MHNSRSTLPVSVGRIVSAAFTSTQRAAGRRRFVSSTASVRVSVQTTVQPCSARRVDHRPPSHPISREMPLCPTASVARNTALFLHRCQVAAPVGQVDLFPVGPHRLPRSRRCPCARRIVHIRALTSSHTPSVSHAERKPDRLPLTQTIRAYPWCLAESGQVTGAL